MTSPGDSQPPKDWWLENACRIAAFRLRQAKYLSSNTLCRFENKCGIALSSFGSSGKEIERSLRDEHL